MNESCRATGWRRARYPSRMDFALRMLDDVQRLPELEALDAARFAEALAADLADEAAPATVAAVGAELDRLRDALAAIDRFTSKAMRIHLLHGLAHLPVPPQLHTLLVTTIVSYADDTRRLRQRLRATIGRSDERAAEEIAGIAGEAADRVLGQRRSLRAGVLTLAQSIAKTRATLARATLQDRSLDDKSRRGWRQALADLDLLVESSARLDENTHAQRLAALPEPEPEAPREDPVLNSRFEGLEID